MVKLVKGALQAVAAAALILLLAPLPATAQSYAYRPPDCWNGSSYGGCDAARSSYGGTHAYERWQDNTPALGSGSPSPKYQFPHYLGGHSAWYGLGR